MATTATATANEADALAAERWAPLADRLNPNRKAFDPALKVPLLYCPLRRCAGDLIRDESLSCIHSPSLTQWKPGDPHASAQAEWKTMGKARRKKLLKADRKAVAALKDAAPVPRDELSKGLEFSAPLSRKILAFSIQASEKWCRYLQTHRT
jgi:hypothetical protein